MKWLWRVLAGFVALAAVLALVPFFVTFNDYIPALEKELSARIGQPVSIERVHVGVLPSLHARLDGVSVGGADLKIGNVILKPDFWSLFRRERVIREVEIEDVTLNEPALGALAALTQRDRGAGTLRVENVRLANAVLKLKTSTFGPFDAHVRISTAAAPGHLALKTRDGALNVDVTPDGERYLLDIAGRGWTPPLGPPIRFDELNVKAVSRAHDAELTAIRAKLYGGTATGRASIAWARGVVVNGSVELKQVDVEHAAALVSPKSRLTGKLDARPVFNAEAQTAAALGDALHLETPFAVTRGVLHNFDLIRAATTLGKSTGGGETRFDQLSGRLTLERRSYRFSDLKIASGPLGAQGNVAIAPSRALSGELKVNPGGFGLASIPLSVGGTLDAPVLLPNARAIAAAAAGTAILGPGIGTAAGAKIGELMEGVIGKSRKR